MPMEEKKTGNDPLIIGDRTFNSRLILGTSRYPNQQVLLDALESSGTEMVTVSVRRISIAREGESLLDLLGDSYHLLPNTAGCYTARDAVLTAQLAREALETNWVKVEVIGDDETLFPDVEQLLIAAEELVKDARGQGNARPPRRRHLHREGGRRDEAAAARRDREGARRM